MCVLNFVLVAKNGWEALAATGLEEVKPGRGFCIGGLVYIINGYRPYA